VGLPEVTLGLIPGAGGTQLLPRLIGRPLAAEIITSGQPIDATRAQNIGLIDAISSDPVSQAITWIKAQKGVARAAQNPEADNAEVALSEIKEKLARRYTGAAPLKALHLVERALSLPLAEGLQAEREVFLQLKSSPETTALRHVFFAERRAVKTSQKPNLRAALVIGGGTMGVGIAWTLFAAGIPVQILETDGDAVARARLKLQEIAQTEARSGRFDVDKATDAIAAIHVAETIKNPSAIGLAIEAIYENMDAKRAVLERLEAALPTDAILATNTSYLNLSQMSENLKHRDRFIGLHFFAPAHRMKLLEVVVPPESSGQVVHKAYGLAKRLGKIPVRTGICDGFIGNRILKRYRSAMEAIITDQTTPWAIDTALQEFGFALGPFAVQDLSGLDISFANRERLRSVGRAQEAPPCLGDDLVAVGHLGRKTGEGWYDYAQKPPQPSSFVRGMLPSGPLLTSDVIVARALAAITAEASDILAEGIAKRAAHIDLVLIHGYGFPRWRGGPLFASDAVGLSKIGDDLRTMGQPIPPLLRQLIDANIRFADYDAQQENS
jgi:3-hydroxyacyl-CoA dehydrogenase